MNEPRTRPLLVWLALAWLVGYAIFFFSFTLPNSHVRRVDVWLELPDFLLANIVTPPNAEPSSWLNLSQRWDLLAVAAVIWAGAWATGCHTLRLLQVSQPLSLMEREVFACGVGVSLVSLLTLGLGLAGFMSPFGLGSVLLGAVVVECLQRLRVTRHTATNNSPTSEARSHWKQTLRGVLAGGEQIPYGFVWKSLAVVAMTLFLLAMLLGSMLPPTDFDVKAYHLTGPKEYFQNGRITFLSHNVYTNFPFLTEMLCLLGMVLRGDWFRGALAGQAVLMGFAPLTALALYCAGRRWFGSTVGWFAAVIYLSTPWTYRLAIIAYVEGALSCYLFLTLFAVLLAVENLTPRLYLLAGLLAGSAMACKYPGLVSVVIPMTVASFIVVWRKTHTGVPLPQGEGTMKTASPTRITFQTLLAFSLGVAIAIGPWLLKNLVETGNPVYPLAYGIFGGRDWDAASHAKWRAGHSPANYAVSDLAEKFIDVTAKADWLSPLLFGLAPLTLLVCRGKQCGLQTTAATANSQLATRNSQLLRWLWLYVGFLFAQWWLLTHRIDRFWVPMIPVVALLAGVGATWSASVVWRRGLGAFVALSVLFNLGFVTTPLCGFSAYLSDFDKARAGCESTADGIHFLNQLHDVGRLPPDAVVLCVGEAQVFDARVKVIYNTVFDQPIFRDWLASRPNDQTPESDWPLRSPDEIRRILAEQGVTHIFVNWQELLRYRTTYSYSDFVAPQRFAWLHQQGLIDNPVLHRDGRDLRAYDTKQGKLDAKSRAELDRWAPELTRQINDELWYVGWQLFPVK